MAPRVSPSKRKHAETGRTIRQQTLLSGARMTRGTAPQTQEGTKMPASSKELASLSTPQPGADRRGLRSASGLATQSIVMRKANAATQGASNSVPAAPAAARSRTPAAATKPSKKQQQQPYAGQCRHLAHATIDEETFRVGDNVYVVLNTQLVAGILSDDDKDDCVCLVCGDAEKEARVMLECDRCLAGCHLGCLSPPLTDVPEGEWVCPGCKAGRAPAARPPCTACDCLLQRHGLGLARIESMWQEPNGDMQCVYRWYCLPEETHTGRQRHHLAREMFLTQLRDSDSMDAILRPAHVLDPHAFGKGAACSELGEDVFVCEYVYDSAWQRFRRRTEFGDSDSEDEGEEWAPEGQDAGSDGECEGLQPEHMPGKARTNKRCDRKGRNGRKQGGQEYLEQVGALEVPQHARQRQREGSSALSQARSVLALTSVPRTLPCREAERGQVAAFVEEVLAEDCGKCLYISGIPGTGKTATVLEVMRGLKRKSEARKLPQFQFVEINGLRLASPQHAYSALYEALTGDRAGPQTAATALEEMFRDNGSGKNGKGARRPTILLIDEMDQLVNKTQTVLYNLFDWPGRKTSRLSIIGIANTMDLPERLHPRIGSRLAGRRVVFQPYSRDQLNEIIKSRLDGLAAFQPNALEFISRKVANCSGDVRRCLELCRRAAEIAEDKQHRQQQQQQRAGPGSSGGANDSMLQQERGMVEMRHVAAAIAEMFNTGHVRLLREACRLERLVLAAIYLETSSSGRAECLLGDVWERLRVLCSQNCEAQRYDFGSVLERAAELGSKRLIICDPAVRRLRAKVALNVATNDLTMMLTIDAELPWLALAISRAAMAPMAPVE